MLNVDEYPGWNLIITNTAGTQGKIVAITPRLSCSEDLYQLDNMQTDSIQASASLPLFGNRILLQVATKRTSDHKRFLDWIINKRNLSVVPGVMYIDAYL